MKNINPQTITRIKNISNKENGKAYLDLTEKEFVLHYPNKRSTSILETSIDELVILYQRMSDGNRYLTHLVKPIDNEIIEENLRQNFKYGRVFEVIAYTGEENKIPFEKTSLSKLDFRNNGWGDAVEIKNIAKTDNIKNIQNEIFNIFKPFAQQKLDENKNFNQSFYNDELNEDFESKEGKELFRLHRIRERDSKLTYLKKQNAIKTNNLKCEVCSFSFQNKYKQDYIECHHKIPIFNGERITKLEDLALVCSNCHRMLHRKINGKFLTVDQLKKIIN